MSAVLQFNLGLDYTECYKCAVVFAMPRRLMQQCRNNGQEFFCPNGHGQIFAKSTVQRLQEQLEQEQRRTQAQRNQREMAERQLVAAKGLMTKLKKRIANGVCPCCRRSFTNLRRHITKQHPAYVEGN